MRKPWQGLFFLALMPLSCSVNAVDEKPARWIEVEVILFTRDIPEDSIREEFPQKVNPIHFRRTRDLLTEYHFPDIRETFRASTICDYDAVLAPVSFDIPILPALDDMNLNIEVAIDPLAELAAPEYLVQEPIELPSTPIRDIVEPNLAGFVAPNPNGCNANPKADFWTKTYDFGIKNETNNDYHYDLFPRVIDAGEMEENPYVHLMAKRNFRLRDIYRTLRRQPNIRPILHTAWRQPGVAPKYSRATRLYAGIDYSNDFDFQGRPLPKENLELQLQDPEQVDFVVEQDTKGVVDNIERLLAMVDQGAKINYQTQNIEPVIAEQNSRPDPTVVREVDGLLRIYIDSRNYLHIKPEFNLRRKGTFADAPKEASITSLLSDTEQTAQQPVPMLNSYHFKQTRRVISKQLHYFDHPYMGIIIQIRRYGW
jgi:hypothetical protein